MGWSTTTRPSPHFSGSQGASTSPCRRTGPLAAASVPSTEVTSGQPRPVVQEGAGDQEITLLCQGLVRESGVAAILYPGPRGSRNHWFRMLSLQVRTRMFPVLHGHMRGSIRREICDFQASISPDHLKYQEFLSFAAAQKGG